jgi:hypothetical protein
MLELNNLTHSVELFAYFIDLKLIKILKILKKNKI